MNLEFRVSQRSRDQHSTPFRENLRLSTTCAQANDDKFLPATLGYQTWHYLFGDINGTKLIMEILPKGKGKYVFAALAKDPNRSGTVDPVTIGLTIGDATGSASITAFFE